MNRLPLLLALFLALVPAALPAQEPGFPAATEPTLQPGDRLMVQVWRNPELTGEFVISEDGTIQHPIYSQVQVVDVPLPAVRDRIRTFLGGYEANPMFTFIPEFRVYVGGAVREQNQFYFPQISIGQAITRAGGSTTPSPRYRVRLIREGRETRANLDGAEAAAMLQQPILSGDQILVEERPTFARRYLSPTLTVLQTVTSLVSTYVFFDAIFNK